VKRLVIYAGAGDLGWCCDELVVCPPEEELELDLSQLTFVSPLFLVRLRGWLDHHARLGTHVRVIAPAGIDVRNYMSRMHVCEGLHPNIDFALPTVRENPLRDRLIAVTRVDSDGREEFDELLGGLLDSEDMRHAGYLAEVVAETAEEMMQNAVWHGVNATGAYIAAQRFRYPQENAPHVCVVAIGDMGVGMAEHLSRGGEGRTSDALTIAHGMTDMVSGTGEEHRGHGYQVPFDIARQTEAAFVDLRVRANAGWVEKRNDGEPRGLFCPGPCVGTWVNFTFAHSSPPE
jgi:hypothetical protein